MIANDILDLARSLNLRIAIAESCTGGMVAVALTDIPGSSDVMDRGFVTYSNAAKVEMLGVSTDTLMAHGAVSEQVAGEMAEGALSRSGADLSVAITGIAGPGGSEHKPEGRVCFGLARKGLKTFTETKEFGAPGRSEVRQMSRDHALELLYRSLS
ncbi:CinA family protein [Roseovarius pacificus]|uniref:CinA family protein n=1 Tax=Roseovarius pacificus TaxID=337701 RepID=UPI0040393483